MNRFSLCLVGGAALLALAGPAEARRGGDDGPDHDGHCRGCDEDRGDLRRHDHDDRERRVHDRIRDSDRVPRADAERHGRHGDGADRMREPGRAVGRGRGRGGRDDD